MFELISLPAMGKVNQTLGQGQEIVARWLKKPSPSHLTCALSRAVYEHHQSNDWTTSDIEAREDSITQHACKVFSF